MLESKYIIEYLGRTVYLNKELILKLNISKDKLDDIKQLHRQIINCDLSLTKAILGAKSHRDFLLRHWERLQFDLQEAWGFEKDKKYHKFWLLNSCNCPKLDNEDRYPSGYYVMSEQCVLQGKEIKEKENV